MEDLDRLTELAGGQYRNRIHRAMRNGAWISAVPQCLNVTELSWEELWDNIRLRYGLMSQDIPATCDVCGKRFYIKHAISQPKGGLVLARNENAAKEWGSLVSQALIPSAISY